MRVHVDDGHAGLGEAGHRHDQRRRGLVVLHKDPVHRPGFHRHAVLDGYGLSLGLCVLVRGRLAAARADRQHRHDDPHGLRHDATPSRSQSRKTPRLAAGDEPVQFLPASRRCQHNHSLRARPRSPPVEAVLGARFRIDDPTLRIWSLRYIGRRWRYGSLEQAGKSTLCLNLEAGESSWAGLQARPSTRRPAYFTYRPRRLLSGSLRTRKERNKSGTAGATFAREL